MKAEDFLREKIAVRIWNQYMNRVQRMLRHLEAKEREDIAIDIQLHLFESFKRDGAVTETEKLLNALDRMGEPEEYLKPLLADSVLVKAARTLNPRLIVESLGHLFYGGLKRGAIALFFFVGYSLVVAFLLIAALKPIFPDQVGLFIGENRGFLLGAYIGDSDFGKEYLGYWVIPAALAAAAILYVGLTKLLRLMKRRRPKMALYS